MAPFWTHFLGWYLYDYILTFPLEISAIWKSKLNATTILFAVNRYFFLIASIADPALGLVGTDDIKVSSLCASWYGAL